MKLDSNLAWQSAHSAIKANREVLLALAGAFFLLPSLAFALLYPQPQTPASLTPQQATALLEGFYREAFPFMIPVLLAQILGAMTILTLFTDRTRPTVGTAIAAGAIDSAVFFAAMVLFWIVAGLAIGILVGLFALSGVAALAAGATAFALGLMLYFGIRLILLMPVIAVEEQRNPIAALRRSWELTRGNAGRILLFLLILTIAYLIVTGVLTALAGILFSLLLGARGGEIAVVILTSLLGTVFTLYVVTLLAMIHRQLAGPSPETLETTFD